MEDYIQGKKQGKEANRLEREALNNPFLQDAIDGFDTVNGNHPYAVSSLEKELEKRIQSKEKSSNRLWWMGIAASIVFIIGFGTMILFNNKPNDLAAGSVMEENEVYHQPEQIDQDSVNQVQLAPQTEPDKLDIIAGLKSPESKKELAFAVEDEISVHEFALDSRDMQKQLAPVKESISATDESAMVDMMDIAGEDQEVMLDEVIIVGYGVQKKPDMTGSTISIGEEKSRRKKEKKAAETAVEQAMQGRASGVQVTTGEETPGNAKIPAYFPDSLYRKKVLDVPFGEKEFKAYFEENRSKEICAGEKATIKVRFLVDETGTPVNWEVKKSTCDELEKELIRLLESSPKWTNTGQVKLEIRLK